MHSLQGLPLDLAAFVEYLRPKGADQHSVMFDCTASEVVTGQYLGCDPFIPGEPAPHELFG